MEDRDRLLTTADVARILHISKRTVLRWTELGLIPELDYPGHSKRYRASDIRALIRATKTSGSGVPLTTSAPDPDSTQEGSS